MLSLFARTIDWRISHFDRKGVNRPAAAGACGVPYRDLRCYDAEETAAGDIAEKNS